MQHNTKYKIKSIMNTISEHSFDTIFKDLKEKSNLVCLAFLTARPNNTYDINHDITHG